jgi:hypothetical protein
MEKYKPVLVEWEDTTCFAQQQRVEDVLELKPTAFQTLGFLVANRQKRLIVAGDIGTDGCLRDINIIPRGCITKITYLRSL